MQLLRHRVAVVGMGLALLAACRSSSEREYWWEAGYPYGKGSAPASRSEGTAVRVPPAPLPAGPGATVDTGGVLAQLRGTSVPALSIEDEESLTAAVEALRAVTGLPLVVDPAAETAALDEGAVFDLALTHPLSARHVLDLLVEQAGPAVAWTIRHEAILVTTREKSRGGVAMQAHDIRALVAAQTGYVAPRIGRLRSIDELADEDGGSPFGSQEVAAPRFEEDDVVTLVQENVAVGTWDEDGVSISSENGLLFVSHAPAVQRRVAEFLAALAGF